MFQRGKDTPISTYGFLVGIEIEDGSTTPEAVALHLADSVSWLEGVGKADVELLGKLDVYGDEDLPLDSQEPIL